MLGSIWKLVLVVGYVLFKCYLLVNEYMLFIVIFFNL